MPEKKIRESQLDKIKEQGFSEEAKRNLLGFFKWLIEADAREREQKDENAAKPQIMVRAGH